MAVEKKEEEEGGEFADFLADISEEIAQRVASLDPPPPSSAESKKTPVPPPDAGMIAEWENVADRIIEEMR
ncbi:MAG TPA: hypothetical protein VE110_08320 [Gemmatimonadaceae bacterium]|nr:hypothetical protein [Gemmatimonadaceae bacterium]